MAKRKLKFNLMDALILFVILAAVLVLLYVFVFSDTMSADSVGQASKRITYVVEITGMSEEYLDRIQIGESVIDSSKKMGIGTVTALEQHPYLYMGTNQQEGKLVLNTVDDYATLYATLEADAVLDGYTYRIDGYDIYVGKLVYMAFSDFVCSGYCIAMEVSE